MDVASYFQHVLGASYMVRVRFADADYVQVEGGRKGKAKRKKGERGYTSQGADAAGVANGRLDAQTVESLLSKLSERDCEQAKRDNGMPVLVALRTLKGTGDSLDGEFTHEALLVAPADLSLAGELTFPAEWKARSPWMPRALLAEQGPRAAKGVEKAELAVGTYASYAAFVNSLEAIEQRGAIDSLGGLAQWHAYLDYCTQLYDAVFDCPQEALASAGLEVDDQSVFVVFDDNVNVSEAIEELYRNIGSQKAQPGALDLFNRLADPAPRTQQVASLAQDGAGEMLEHAGAASREHPLADSQRLAVHRHAALPQGEVLAVSGPPGTGKTTLLQSIVADLLVHHALDDAMPPVIVGSSTNNQAVTNIIDAFAKDVVQAEGDSVYRRWLPDVLVSKDEGMRTDPDHPLHSFGVYSPSSQRRDEAREKGYLADGVERRSDELYQYCTKAPYCTVAPGVYKEQASHYFGKPCKSVGYASNLVASRLAEVDQLRRELVSLVPFQPVPPERLPRQCGQIIQKLQGYGAIDAKGHPIPLEACTDLVSLDRALDTTVRPLEFWLAVHFYEGAWLTAPYQRGDSLKSRDRDVVREYHAQMAALMPLSVMTMFRMPRQFKHNDADGNNKLSDFGAIDLLIVDEAGQVDTAVGAASFALAKRAVVVGDVFQLPPIWRLEPERDFQIAQGFMDPGCDQRAAWEGLQAAGLSSSRTSSLMVAAQASCPWSYESAHAQEHEQEPADGFWARHGFEASTEEEPRGGLFLSEHRRCVDSIIQYCNELVYDGKLVPARGNAQKADIGLPAMGFCATQGKEAPSGTSRKNPEEAKAVAAWIGEHFERLWQAYGTDGQPADPKGIIGVVTPFAAQAEEVRAVLRRLDAVSLDGEERELADLVTVGTAHKLQGAECLVVLFSLVYGASSTARFVEGNPNLMNVAVSRAKDAFVVFGDEKLLAGSGDSGVLGLLKTRCYPHKVPPASEAALQRVQERRSAVPARAVAQEQQPAPDEAFAPGKAILAATAKGFWPQTGPQKAKDFNILLSEEFGLVEKDAQGMWVPTTDGAAIGIKQTAPNEHGEYWCVYTEAAMRSIAARIVGQ